MAHFNDHCRDCMDLLGDRCENVNRWMDAEFKRFGPLHRFARHHTSGIAEAEELFGVLGRRAALVHILRDCGHIPTPRQWKEQIVDSLGMLPTARFNGYWDPHQFTEAATKMLNEEPHEKEM